MKLDIHSVESAAREELLADCFEHFAELQLSATREKVLRDYMKTNATENLRNTVRAQIMMRGSKQNANRS
jgi:hypothetical protein